MKTNNQKHLTFSNRVYIEQELNQKSSFKSIATTLGKDSTTISKEIKKNRILVKGKYLHRRCYICKNYNDCILKCGDPFVSSCPGCNNYRLHCKNCYKHNPKYYCSLYAEFTCDTVNKAPYVCNSCPNNNKCPIDHYLYDAKRAQKYYEKRLTLSRKGINMTIDELNELDSLISPLVLKGQPLSHIFAVHSDDIPVCRRTLYNYFDQRVFTARNIDLPRRVRYKKRKKSAEPRKRAYQQTYRNKRTYVDFEKFMAAHPDANVVEMDTVKGSRAKGKCLLTLLFRNCNFMIVILMPNCTQKSVVNAINNLTEKFGIRTFRKYFPVILTDNGSEFKNPWDIENTPSGSHRTYVFYCDPYASNQKGKLEKNHEFIRYVIPKGKSMQNYIQEDIDVMTSHINSTAREMLNNTSPFDLAELLLDKKIPLLAGQVKVSPDDVMLKPGLIENRVKARLNS